MVCEAVGAARLSDLSDQSDLSDDGCAAKINRSGKFTRAETTLGVSRHRLTPTGKSYLLPRIIAYTAYSGLFGLLPRLAAQARKPNQPLSPNAHDTINRTGGKAQRFLRMALGVLPKV